MEYLDTASLRLLIEQAPLEDLMTRASALRDSGHGSRISYSRKVFIPLTKLCRDVCSYCTFAEKPVHGQRSYLTKEEVLAIARDGEAAQCREALFTLGDKPELRYRAAREELAELGYATTVDYLLAMCRLILDETGLLPHVNAGVMTGDEITRLREVSVSQGIMLESTAERLCDKGGPHYGSPDKHPVQRLEMIKQAGVAKVPFTSGILIGIGETRGERMDAILALRDLHAKHGHLQEIIVQNFRAKPGTRMAFAAEPDREELLWTIAATRLAFGPTMNIQAPPNLSGEGFGELIVAGINDWGGVSPVTPDHVNPEARWPSIPKLEQETAIWGKTLVERLAVYPSHLRDMERWQTAALHPRILNLVDADGLVRKEDWRVGGAATPPTLAIDKSATGRDARVREALARSINAETLGLEAIVALFEARGPDFDAVCTAADSLRLRQVGNTVRYVINRNINYTNVCFHGCTFCAFSKGSHAKDLRGPAYDLDLDEVARRTAEAWARGATEVCMQGGIHPRYTGETYLNLLQAAKRGAPGIHVHAFSPLEVRHGARSLGLETPAFLELLKDAGLGTLPGTAAEILDDEIRDILCPDKLNTEQWLSGMEAAHRVGLRTTATIMFGHVDAPINWARHLLAIRDLQSRTGGFTEFVPLPFVSMEAPLYLKGRARPGPTFRETVLMHAVARLVLDPLIPNIQASWVKLGETGVLAALNAGANDLGGTLMNESISKAAGASHGQEWPPATMDSIIRRAGRTPAQRTTLYGCPSADQQMRAYDAAPLANIVQTPLTRRSKKELTAHD